MPPAAGTPCPCRGWPGGRRCVDLCAQKVDETGSVIKEGKHILKANADPHAARFRSVIRLYLEVLEEGSLDEKLIPEIEGVFKEVGALAGLRFETIRNRRRRQKEKTRGRPSSKHRQR